MPKLFTTCMISVTAFPSLVPPLHFILVRPPHLVLFDSYSLILASPPPPPPLLLSPQVSRYRVLGLSDLLCLALSVLLVVTVV